ncbi:hypothetical protein JRQ81_005870 [Phrynocephalus forsythii]|uniref:Uncharacterized protein n=1 Tax=Phrynocephalus forsythii TaxID=171643 RepID=A0A9Q0XIX8_9SAUR|nr:hypothetical protein JRQ81_005870 [Phrynocephalus forsythii]
MVLAGWCMDGLAVVDPYGLHNVTRSNGSELLCQVLVMLLSLCEGLWAAPGPRPRPDPRAEFDSIVNLARNLLSDTKNLFNHFKNRYPAEGEHKLETLPVLSMNAVELANIQMGEKITESKANEIKEDSFE